MQPWVDEERDSKMGKQVRRFRIVAFLLAIAGPHGGTCAAFAEDPPSLSEQEITAQLFGNTLQQLFKAETVSIRAMAR